MASFLQKMRGAKKEEPHPDETHAALSETLYSFCEPRDPRAKRYSDATMTLSSLVKCLTLCDLKAYTQNLQASVWQRYQDQRKRVPVTVVANELIDTLAQDYIWWSNGGIKAKKPPPPVADPAVASLASHIRTRLAAWARTPCVNNEASQDAYFDLSWQDKAVIFRLRANYTRQCNPPTEPRQDGIFRPAGLGNLIGKSLRLSQSSAPAAPSVPNCECGGGLKTVEHLLQACEKYSLSRVKFWPKPVAIQTKLYGAKDDLTLTAAFMRKIQSTSAAPSAASSAVPVSSRKPTAEEPNLAATATSVPKDLKPEVYDAKTRTPKAGRATVLTWAKTDELILKNYQLPLPQLHPQSNNPQNQQLQLQQQQEQQQQQQQQHAQQHQYPKYVLQKGISNNNSKLGEGEYDLYKSHRLFYAPSPERGKVVFNENKKEEKENEPKHREVESDI